MSHSFWLDSAPVDHTAAIDRSALAGDVDVDVAVVGAGFTGLWTAQSLLAADPTLRLVVLERERVGFGASGRNGGWCVGDYGGPESAVAKVGGDRAVETMAREMIRAVDATESFVTEHAIDCGFHRGGAIYTAVNDGQLRRLRHHHETLTRSGLGDAWQWLDAADARAILDGPAIRGAILTPHAAAVQPAALALGIAAEVERLGGRIHEATTVEAIRPGGTRRAAVRTDHGTVTADWVVLATEAYTHSVDGQQRRMLPLVNHVIATEPIEASVWDRIGLRDRQLFELGAMLLGYGQRTADDRIVWGGTAAGARWNFGVPPSPSHSARIERRLVRRLTELLPALEGVGVSHRWTGVLGVPRDLLPGIGVDRRRGFAWAGGYTGQGVAAANAAGRGLADLIRGVDTPLTRLPWVDHRSRPWEPEPRTWIGVHAAIAAAHTADLVDRVRH